MLDAKKIAEAMYPLDENTPDYLVGLCKSCREAFMNGFNYGNLTWKDMRMIHNIFSNMIDEEILNPDATPADEEGYYTMALKRFNEKRK